MPRTRRMRNDEQKLNDGWTYEQNSRFVDLLYHEAKGCNLQEVQLLTGACQRITSEMSAAFERRFSLCSIKKKVDQMRNRHDNFTRFLDTPGVIYDVHECSSFVDQDYWRAVPAKVETEWLRYFRMNDEPFHLKLVYIFDTKRVVVFPKDLTGSPEWPIHVRDSDDDELAMVPVQGSAFVPAQGNGSVPAQGSGSVSVIPFSLGNEIVIYESVGENIVGGSSDGMFGSSLWEVD